MTEYKNTTEEQRKSMTPYLKGLFEIRADSYNYRKETNFDLTNSIKAFQQAQKEEIKDLEILKSSLPNILFINSKLAKLKFESELK